MNWVQINERRWKTDCGCRVKLVTTPQSGGDWWVCLNSHGSRLNRECGMYHQTLEQAKITIEEYVTDRTTKGLFPYNSD